MRAIHSGNGVKSSAHAVSLVYVSAGFSDADEFADSCKGLGWIDASIETVSANSEQLDSDEERFMDILESVRDSDLVIVRLHDSVSYFVKFERLLAKVDRYGKPLLLFTNLCSEMSSFRERFPLGETEYARAQTYLELGGKRNFTSIFLLSCALFAGMDIQIPKPDVPLAQGIYHPGLERNAKDRTYLATLDPNAVTVGIVVGHWLWSKKELDGVDRLIEALEARGANTLPIFFRTVRSEVTGSIGVTGCFQKFLMKGRKPRVDSVVMLSGFSQRILESDGVNPFQVLGVTALQSPIIYCSMEEWENDRSGMTAQEISVGAIQTEYDGQVLIPPMHFKGRAGNSIRYEFSRDRISFIADTALAWSRLHAAPHDRIRIALVLNPSPQGTVGPAKGLAVLESLVRIVDALEREGYSVGDIPRDARTLAGMLDAFWKGDRDDRLRVSGANYREWLSDIPRMTRERMDSAYGKASDFVREDREIHGIMGGNAFIGVEPCLDSEDADVPSHQFALFYMWLTRAFRADVVVHIGGHSRLEWLDRKANALSKGCMSDILLGPTPRICLYAVDDPVLAIMAKRRCHSVIVSHIVPPVRYCNGIEGFDDLKRCLQQLMVTRMDGRPPDTENLDAAKGLMDSLSLWNDLSMRSDGPPMEIERQAPRILEYVMDVEGRGVEHGLHVFGAAPRGKKLDSAVQSAMRYWDGDRNRDFASSAAYETEVLRPALRACSREMRSLIDAIGGRYVPPGVSGSPYLGNHDMLPTGTNIHSADLSRIPSRTAFETGCALSESIVSDSIAENGEYPRNATIVINGGKTLSDSGVDISCAMSLVGLGPVWSRKSGILTAMEPIDIDELGRPRVEVRIRANPQVVSLLSPVLKMFEKGLESISYLDEEETVKSMRAQLNRDVATRMMGSMTEKGKRASDSDLPEGGILIMDAESLQDEEGIRMAMEMKRGEGVAKGYILDSSNPCRPKIRSLSDEASLVIRTKVLSPVWLDGLMRHGHDGAAQIARLSGQMLRWGEFGGITGSWMFDSVANVFAFDKDVREWILSNNPSAFCTLVEDLTVASERGYWNADENRLRMLRDLYLYSEGVAEGFGAEDGHA